MDTRAEPGYAARWTIQGINGEKIVTEQEWLACTDAGKMFEVFGGVWGEFRLDPRLRRFAVECCRRVRHLITEEIFLAAANAGEAYADDPRNKKATIPVMARASIEGWRHLRRYESSANRHQFHAAKAAVATCGSTDWHAGFNSMQEAAQALNQADADSFDPAELQYQATLLHCIFGPLLFRHISIDPAWLTWHDGLLVSMARRCTAAAILRTCPYWRTPSKKPVASTRTSSPIAGQGASMSGAAG